MIELTPEEERLILERRQQQAEAERRAQFRLIILKTAFEYEQWLQQTGNGSTFSTFCDDFAGYDGGLRSPVFQCVEAIRKLARDFQLQA